MTVGRISIDVLLEIGKRNVTVSESSDLFLDQKIMDRFQESWSKKFRKYLPIPEKESGVEPRACPRLLTS